MVFLVILGNFWPTDHEPFPKLFPKVFHRVVSSLFCFFKVLECFHSFV